MKPKVIKQTTRRRVVPSKVQALLLLVLSGVALVVYNTNAVAATGYYDPNTLMVSSMLESAAAAAATTATATATAMTPRAGREDAQLLPPGPGPASPTITSSATGTPHVFSRNETLRILTHLGPKDSFAGASFRCSKKEYSKRTPELYWYDYSSSSSSSDMQNNDNHNDDDDDNKASSSSDRQNNDNHNDDDDDNKGGGGGTFKSAKRILLTQSAGFGTYAQLLELTAPMNKAYAKKWGHDFLVVQGTLVVLKEERRTNCTPLEHRSTHNKMQLLQLALSHSTSSSYRSSYDYLLILDADAMIYDFTVDLGQLLPTKSMLGAQRAVPKAGVKKRATWKINAGVTLWNLHHPFTQAVADGWQAAALGYLNGRNNYQGDQLFLYHTLKSNNYTYESGVYSYAKEFYYNKGTVIKHVKRPKLSYEIGETELDGRSELIQKFSQQICRRFPRDCANLDETKYSEL